MSTWRRQPLRVRLVVLFCTLLILALVAVGGLALTLLRGSLVREVDIQLERAGQALVDAAYGESTGGVRSPVNSLLPTDYAVILAQPDGTEVTRCVAGECARATGLIPPTADLGGPMLDSLDVDAVAALGGAPFTVRGPDETTWRVFAAPVTAPDASIVGTAAVALPMTAVDATMGVMIGALLSVSGGVLLVAGIGTYAVVRSNLRPLRRIETTAAQIAAGDLTQRVDDAPESTEVGSLAASLNTMLGQVESSFTAQRASEQRMKAFVGDASHELRTPLATMTGYTELYRLGGIPPQEVSGVMERIESSSVRMTALVADLLSLARLDQGTTLRIEPLDVSEPLADAARDLGALDPIRPVTVDVTTNRRVAADDAALRRVLTNLVGNAAAYSPAGSAVELTARDDGDGVLLSVVDHGPGVPEADRERIFERFARLDAGRTRDSGGTGLGLSIVAAIAQVHGGWARCVATPGGGASMQVWLPAATPAAPEPSREGAPPTAR